MANAVTKQTVTDGHRNLVIRLQGALDTSDESRVIKVDVSSYTPACTRVSINRVVYDVSSQLAILLDWDATTPVAAVRLSGQQTGVLDYNRFGGLPNNAGTGITGDIYLTTTGWASGVQTYMITLEMVKRGTVG